MIPDWLVPAPADRDQLWRLAEFRAAHTEVIIGPSGFGTWQARVPEPTGELVITRDALEDLLDKLYEVLPPDSPPGSEGRPGGG